MVLRRDTGEVIYMQKPYSAPVTRLAIKQSSEGLLGLASGDESGGIYVHSWDSELQTMDTKVRLADFLLSDMKDE